MILCPVLERRKARRGRKMPAATSEKNWSHSTRESSSRSQMNSGGCRTVAAVARAMPNGSKAMISARRGRIPHSRASRAKRMAALVFHRWMAGIVSPSTNRPEPGIAAPAKRSLSFPCHPRPRKVRGEPLRVIVRITAGPRNRRKDCGAAVKLRRPRRVSAIWAELDAVTLVLVVARVVLDQPRGEGVAIERVDHQERARAAVVQVVLERQRGGEPELRVPDVVELQAGGTLEVEGGQVQLAVDAADQGLHGAGAVFDQDLGTLAERLRGQPAQLGVQVRRAFTDGAGGGDGVTAGDVELVSQADRHRLRRGGFLQRGAGEVDAGDR